MHYFLIRYEIFESGRLVYSWHRLTQSSQKNSDGRLIVEDEALETYKKQNPDGNYTIKSTSEELKYEQAKQIADQHGWVLI